GERSWCKVVEFCKGFGFVFSSYHVDTEGGRDARDEYRTLSRQPEQVVLHGKGRSIYYNVFSITVAEYRGVLTIQAQQEKQAGS
ncbi:MAG: hypothetical protein ACYTE8_12835, partial [Planctomycetota bacterium]